MLQKSDQNYSLAAITRSDQTILIDSGNFGIGAIEGDNLSYIAFGAIGEMSRCRNLLRPCRPFQNTLGIRIDLEPHATSRASRIRMGSFRDPISQDLISDIVFAQNFTASVGHFHHRLEYQQALIGINRIHPSTKIFANDGKLIENTIKGAQRQSEASLSAWRTVACTGIATLL